MVLSKQRNGIWLALILLVISANFALYNTSLYDFTGIEAVPKAVIASLIDLIIVLPILLMLYFKKISWKMVISFVALGCIIAYFVIPSHMLAPYQFITTSGIVIEAAIIAFELVLIIGFIVYTPKIIAKVRADERPTLFAYKSLVENRFSNRIVSILADEILMLYYAFASWRKKPEEGITLHKGTSYVGIQIMLIHAILLESIGLHWYLHSKSPAVSIISLLINVYCLFFILADLQATRLHPIRTTAKGFYIHQGLMKNTYIAFDQIEVIIVDPKEIKKYNKKKRAEFMCNDFEEVIPDFLLKMKSPHTINYMYGFKKQYDYIAIKCDAPDQLLTAIQS